MNNQKLCFMLSKLNNPRVSGSYMLFMLYGQSPLQTQYKSIKRSFSRTRKHNQHIRPPLDLFLNHKGVLWEI